MLLAFVVFFAIVALRRPGLLRVAPRDLPLLALLGIFGIAGVQLAYYEAIARLPIGVALVIEYMAPLFVLAWARLSGRLVGPQLWISAALTLTGCFFVVGAYDQGLRSLNALGAAISLLDALLFTLYFILADRLVQRYSPGTLLVWGFGFGLLAWCARRPVWTLPWSDLSGTQWLLILGVVIVSTVLPYFCAVSAVRHLRAARVGITLTAEPVIAALVAWLMLGERLEAAQVAGGAIVMAGIVMAQTARQRTGEV